MPKTLLPSLTGTPRQIAWANNIRHGQLARVRQALSMLTNQFPVIPDLRLRLAHLCNIDQAHWWITHREAPPTTLLNNAKLLYVKYDQKRPYPRTSREATWQAQQLRDRRTVVIDLETTGLGQDAQIVEIAAIRENGDIILNTLVKPEIPIPADATEIHGITDAMVEKAPTLAELWPILCYHLCTAEYLAVYNASFDMPIIRRCAKELEARDATMPQVPYREADDVMRQYVAFSSNTGKLVSLDIACQEAGISIEPQHRALADCRATLALIRHMATSEIVHKMYDW